MSTSEEHRVLELVALRTWRIVFRELGSTRDRGKVEQLLLVQVQQEQSACAEHATSVSRGQQPRRQTGGALGHCVGHGIKYSLDK